MAATVRSSSVVIAAVVFEGITVTDAAGNPVSLTVVDDAGNVIASGPEVARAAWEASATAYRNDLVGQGHLRVLVRLD